MPRPSFLHNTLFYIIQAKKNVHAHPKASKLHALNQLHNYFAENALLKGPSLATLSKYAKKNILIGLWKGDMIMAWPWNAI